MRCRATTTRRGFLRGCGCGALSVAALGLSAGAARLPVSTVTGDGADDERSYPVPTGDGVTIDRAAQVILVRFQNRIYAMALACPHENAAVKWIARNHLFQCTKHDSQYTPDGTYTSGRATRNLNRFPVRRANGSVVVAVDRVYRSDQNPAAWTAAFVNASP